MKVEVLNELSKSLNHIDPDNSLKYAIEAKQLAQELSSLVLQGKSMNYIGVSYYYLNELNLSNESYFASLSIFDSIGFKPGVAKALNNIAWNYKVQKKFDDAIKYFNQSLDIAKDINDLDLIQGILNNIGTVYRNTNRQEKALEIYMQSLRLNQESGNMKWEAYNLNNIGLVYLDLGQFDDALNYFEQAISINFENNFTQEYARNVLNIGSVYIESMNFAKADIYLDSALSIIIENGYTREKLEYFSYKVDLYISSQDYEKALEYERLKNELNSELNQLAWNEKVSEIQTKYDLAQNERELEIAERKLVQQKLIITAGTSFFLLLLGILFLVIKLYKSKNDWAKNIEKLSKEVKQKNAELSEMNEDVQTINDNLEQLVQDRTKLIKSKNDKLVKYAFINSHEVRGPLARVLGLIYLIGLEKKNLEKDDAFQLLDQATHELDDVIRKAGELLRDEDFFTQHPDK